MADKNPIQSTLKDQVPGLASPALRALVAAGITNLEDFTRVSEMELIKLHGMGPKAIRTIREALARHGLEFAKPGASLAISDQANSKIPRCFIKPE